MSLLAWVWDLTTIKLLHGFLALPCPSLVLILCLTDNPVPEPSGGACLLGMDKKTRNKLIRQEVTEKCAFQKSQLCTSSVPRGGTELSHTHTLCLKKTVHFFFGPANTLTTVQPDRSKDALLVCHGWTRPDLSLTLAGPKPSSFHLGGLPQTETCGRQEKPSLPTPTVEQAAGAKSSTRLLGSGSASRTDKTLAPSLVPTEPDRAPDEFRSQAHTWLVGMVLWVGPRAGRDDPRVSLALSNSEYAAILRQGGGRLHGRAARRLPCGRTASPRAQGRAAPPGTASPAGAAAPCRGSARDPPRPQPRDDVSGGSAAQPEAAARARVGAELPPRPPAGAAVHGEGAGGTLPARRAAQPQPRWVGPAAPARRRGPGGGRGGGCTAVSRAPSRGRGLSPGERGRAGARGAGDPARRALWAGHRAGFLPVRKQGSRGAGRGRPGRRGSWKCGCRASSVEVLCVAGELPREYLFVSLKKNLFAEGGQTVTKNHTCGFSL